MDDFLNLNVTEHELETDNTPETAEYSDFEEFQKVLGLAEEKEEKEEQEDEDGTTLPDSQRDGDSEEDDEDDEEDSEDGDEESDEESEEGSEEEVEQEPVELDIDTVITLPSGEEISIEDLAQKYKDAATLEQEKERLALEKEEFSSSVSSLEHSLELSKLEAQRVLDDFDGFDWQKLAQEDPKEFANTKLFVENYAKRKAEIEKAQTQLESQRAHEKEVELQAKAQDCVKVLERDLPEWNQDVYQQVVNHAVELGMSQDAALTLTDAGVIKALYNSMALSKGKESVKNKAKIIKKSPTKVITSGAKKKEKSSSKANPNYTNENDEFAFFSKFL